MRCLRAALLLSLVLNLALAGYRWFAIESPAASPPAMPPPPTDSIPTASPAVVELTLAEVGAGLTDDRLSDHALVKRLRAAGVPPEVMTILLRDRLQHRHAARWQAVADQALHYPYWQHAGYLLPPEIMHAVHELNREENLTLAALLGDDFAASDALQTGRGALDFISPDKQVEVALTIQDYDELRGAITSSNLNTLLPGDHAVLNLLQDELDADLAGLLTPEELSLYHQRVSPAAHEVQQTLRRFPATEAEYLQLLALHDTIEARFGSTGYQLPRAERDARRAAWNEARQTFVAALPPERAELWAVTQERSFEPVQHWVYREGLPSQTAVDLVRLARNTTAQADALRQDPALTDAQRQLALITLTGQARQFLEKTLPAAQLEAYLQSNGRWLSRLNPPSP